jgi:hypothetical protein
MTMSRSAHHTLNGYKYQFDKAIIALSEARDDEPVGMEGIEDIDVGTGELIQCKYHATQRYFPSAIRKPIIEFLKHFSAYVGTPPKYTLYAHFAENAPAAALTAADIKLILGNDDEGKAFSLAQIETFASEHLRFVLGPEIDEQTKQAQQRIRHKLSCSQVDCEFYFYSNALALILNLSRQPTAALRTITPRKFFQQINRRQLLLDHWLSQLQSAEDYVRYCSKRLHTRRSLTASKERYLVLSDDFLASCQLWDVAHLIVSTAQHSFGMGHAMYNSLPWTIIFECESSVMREIKTLVIKSQIPFNDGHEHIHFCDKTFNDVPIINLQSSRNRRTNHVIETASYHVRLITKHTFESARSVLRPPTVLIDIAPSGSESIPHFHDADNYLFSGVSTVDDLVQVLTAKDK